MTLKHKQLAKAIKQHHHNFVIKGQEVNGQLLSPLQSKTLTSSQTKIAEADTLVDKRQMRRTLSPK